MPENDIWRRAVDLVGKLVLEKLALHGLVVVDRGALDRFLNEHRQSNDRLRAAAAASMKAVGLVSLRLEIVVRDGVPTVIATAPIGQERELARHAAAVIANEWDPPEGWARRKRESSPDRDTNDVDVYAKDAEPDVPSAAAQAALQRARGKALGIAIGRGLSDEGTMRRVLMATIRYFGDPDISSMIPEEVVAAGVVAIGADEVSPELYKRVEEALVRLNDGAGPDDAPESP